MNRLHALARAIYWPIWRLLAVREYRRQAPSLPTRLGWQYSKTLRECFDDGWTARDAVDADISYWEC